MADRKINDFGTLAELQDDDLLLVATDDETYNVKLKVLKEVTAERAEAAASAAAQSAKEAAESIKNLTVSAEMIEEEAVTASKIAKGAISDDKCARAYWEQTDETVCDFETLDELLSDSESRSVQKTIYNLVFDSMFPARDTTVGDSEYMALPKSDGSALLLFNLSTGDAWIYEKGSNTLVKKEIPEKYITSSMIAPGAIIGENIGLQAIGPDNLAPNSVRSYHIMPSSIGRDHIDVDSIDKEHIKKGAVTDAKLYRTYCEHEYVTLYDFSYLDSLLEDTDTRSVLKTIYKIEFDSTFPDRDSTVGEYEYVGVANTDRTKLLLMNLSNGNVWTYEKGSNTLVEKKITSSMIAPGAVVGGKLGQYAVDEDAIKPGAVTENKLQKGAVTEDKLAEHSVSEDKLDRVYWNKLSMLSVHSRALLNSLLESDLVTPEHTMYSLQFSSQFESYGEVGDDEYIGFPFNDATGLRLISLNSNKQFVYHKETGILEDVGFGSSVDLRNCVPTTRKIAGLDLTDDITSDELSDALNLNLIFSEGVNIFNSDDVTLDHMRVFNIGQGITKIVEQDGYAMSNQAFSCKVGDVIRTNHSWVVQILVYNSDGICVENTSVDDSRVYTVTSDAATQFTIQTTSQSVLSTLMVTVNNDMPSNYVPYSKNLIDKVNELSDEVSDGKKYFNKPFVVLSFDAFNLTDNRFKILNDEYGYKATIANTSSSDINKSVMKAGWDIGLYKYGNYPPDILGYDESVSESPTEEVLTAWDAYVQTTMAEAETNGVYNPTVWLARQGCSCCGLETALKKYGIPMCRGAYSPDYSNDVEYSSEELPTMTVSVNQTLMPSTLEDCKTAIAEAVANKKGIAFLTHGIYETETEANENYGITETALRAFLDTVKAYVDSGQLEVLTYREVYAKYYSDEAKKLDYNRLLKSGDDDASIITEENSSAGNYTLISGTERRYKNARVHLGIVLPDSISDDFECSLVFRSGDDTATSITCPSFIKWSGDDVESVTTTENGDEVTYNCLVPKANKTYNVIFWYDGFNVNAVSRGVTNG